MKTYLTLSAIALAAAATLSSGAVMAADPAPTPEFTIAYNIGATSDYRVRGIKQNNNNPALQGGVDIAHSSGLYVGTWGSNVSEWTAPGSKANLEIDYYGGYKTEVAGVALDLGTIYYSYPGVTGKNTANTHEAYVGATYGPAAFKVSRTLGHNYFTAVGWGGSNISASGTMYYDLTLSQEVMPKLTLAAHAGYTDFKDAAFKTSNDTTKKFSYADYNVGLTYDYEGYLLGVKYYFNNESAGVKDIWAATGGSTNNKNLYKNGLAFSVLKAF
jgi:uncharacterized protein (TIGR02001 family)